MCNPETNKGDKAILNRLKTMVNFRTQNPTPSIGNMNKGNQSFEIVAENYAQLCGKRRCVKGYLIGLSSLLEARPAL